MSAARPPAEPSPSVPDLHHALQHIADLLAAREEDFDSLRQMQLEWLQFQSTLDRLINLIDGNGHPPIAERLLLLEEQLRRLSLLNDQVDVVKHRLIALLLGLTLSLIATLFALMRE